MKHLNIQEHFQVPEGYFDNFTSHMMSILPEQEFQPMKVVLQPVQTVRRISPMVARITSAAAVAVLLLVSTYTLFNNKEARNTEIAAFSSAELADEAMTINDATDFAMLDREDVFEMLTEL